MIAKRLLILYNICGFSAIVDDVAARAMQVQPAPLTFRNVVADVQTHLVSASKASQKSAERAQLSASRTVCKTLELDALVLRTAHKHVTPLTTFSCIVLAHHCKARGKTSTYRDNPCLSSLSCHHPYPVSSANNPTFRPLVHSRAVAPAIRQPHIRILRSDATKRQGHQGPSYHDACRHLVSSYHIYTQPRTRLAAP